LKDLTKYFISFFIIYTIIAIFNTYFVYYLPFYFYDVLKVENELLAILQMIVLFTPVFLPPLLGILYDRINKYNHAIVSIACLILPFAFFFVLSNMEDIFNFFLFFTFAYSAIWLIRGAMIKNYLNALSTEDKDLQASIMTKTVYISQSSSILGTLLTMVLYFSINDISSVADWRLFLFLGFFISLPILSSIFLNTTIRPSINLISDTEKKMNHRLTKKSKYHLLIPIISTVLLMFFTETDELYRYSLPSWIGTAFSYQSLDIYFKTVILSYFCAIFGNFLAKKLYSRFITKISKKNELPSDKLEELKGVFIRKVLLFLFISYQAILWWSFNSDFFTFIIIWWTLLPILGSALKIYLTFLISRQAIQLKKYKTTAYMLQTSIANIGMLVFTPIGIFLYPIIGMRLLVLVSIIISTFYLIINLHQISSSKKNGF